MAGAPGWPWRCQRFGYLSSTLISQIRGLFWSKNTRACYYVPVDIHAIAWDFLGRNGGFCLYECLLLGIRPTVVTLQPHDTQFSAKIRGGTLNRLGPLRRRCHLRLQHASPQYYWSNTLRLSSEHVATSSLLGDPPRFTGDGLQTDFAGWKLYIAAENDLEAIWNNTEKYFRLRTDNQLLRIRY